MVALITFFPFVQKAQACLYQRRGCTLQVKDGDDDLRGKQEKFHPELRVKLNKLLKKKVDFVVAFVPTEDGPGLPQPALGMPVEHTGSE